MWVRFLSTKVTLKSLSRRYDLPRRVASSRPPAMELTSTNNFHLKKLESILIIERQLI